MPSSDFKKKLYQFHPQRPPVELETFRTLRKNRREKLDPLSVERGVRQLLEDKISGNLVGLWLLAPEHLRMGTWDLLTRWAGPSSSDLSSRMAMQLVHEAALGIVHLRAARTLSQKGFELLNGLPFVVSDQSIHDLLLAHTVRHAEELQLALGCLRRARGHFQGRLLAIRFGQMSMALIAQTVCDQLRKRLGEPFASWDASHFASAIFRGIDGDIRVSDNTIIVTLYNAPGADLLKKHYESLPQILERENVDPRIPWLYNFKLDLPL